MSAVDFKRLGDVLGMSEDKARKVTVNELWEISQERGVSVSELVRLAGD